MVALGGLFVDPEMEVVAARARGIADMARRELGLTPQDESKLGLGLIDRPQELLNLTYWRRLHGVRQVTVPAKLKVDRRGLPVFRVPAWTAPA